MIIDSHQHFWKYDPFRDAWTDASMKVNITVLSKFEDVSCKLSGMVTEVKNFIFKNQDFTPFLDHFFTSFGPNRLLFGSDWPVCLLAADYKKVLIIIKNYVYEKSIL